MWVSCCPVVQNMVTYVRTWYTHIDTFIYKYMPKNVWFPQLWRKKVKCTLHTPHYFIYIAMSYSRSSNLILMQNIRLRRITIASHELNTEYNIPYSNLTVICSFWVKPTHNWDCFLSYPGPTHAYLPSQPKSHHSYVILKQKLHLSLFHKPREATM